jgi:hypothetical protein
MDEERLRELLQGAMVNCFNEEEKFTCILLTLGERIHLPLQARIVGEDVEVIGLDDEQSDLRRGIVARVRKGGREYTVGLAELEFVDPDPESADWLAAYCLWLNW